jgi:hypothetical protein
MSTLKAIRRRLGHLALGASEVGLEAIGIERASALLVLGHMRSGSTLLLHLLMTNPEISAMGERNATYASTNDLARLVIATRLARLRPFAHLRYVADQVNHNQFTPNHRVLEDPRVRLVFLLRQPHASLTSLLDLTRTYYHQPWSVARAVDYYVERLQTLAAFADRLDLDGRAAFLTYEDLTDQPGATLALLQAFLGLSAGFSQTYDTHRFTGKRGDPSANIGAGRIVRPRSLHGAPLPSSALERASRAHSRCRDALARFALQTPG